LYYCTQQGKIKTQLDLKYIYTNKIERKTQFLATFQHYHHFCQGICLPEIPLYFDVTEPHRLRAQPPSGFICHPFVLMKLLAGHMFL